MVTKKKPVIKPQEETKKANKSDYGAKDIFVLKGLEPVRKRPAMYIGTTGPDGLHHLIYEIINNSIDEAIGGFCNEIKVEFLPKNQIRIIDNGRGIPVEIHPQTKKSTLETIITTLHAGGKFGGKAYQVSGGLHGVGLSVVCALSSYMRVEVCRDGGRFFQEYSKGLVKTKVIKIGPSKETGTSITFDPDPEIFPDTNFDSKKILEYLRQQAYLTKGIKITVLDKREKMPAGFPQTYNFYFEGGIASYVKYLTKGRNIRHDNIFYSSDQSNGIIVETALCYIADEYEFLEESFANNIFTREGGTHLTGFRTALTRSLNDYARKNGFLKENDVNLSGQDVHEGLTAVISIKIRDPQFEGQTKEKLGNPEARIAVDTVVSEKLIDFLERNPSDARAIVENCVLSQKARNAAKAARETVLRKGILEGLSLPGKLADCSSKDPEKSEIFIVEGESAGGCFSEETKVALADGRNLSFKELTKEDREGKKNYCYTINNDGSIGIELIKNPRKTYSNVNVIKVILDNGEEIICTPDHKFMLKDGSYEEARNLTSQDSLMPLNRQFSKLGKRITIKGYELVYDNQTKRWIFTHLLADKYNLAHKVYSKEKGDTLHHIDFNKLNNNPDNLTRMPNLDHFLYHTKFLEKTIHRDDIKEKARQAHKLQEYREKIRQIMTTPEMRRMLSARAKKQWENEEYKQYMTKKFLDFYKKNKKYREENKKLLYKNQETYWSDPKNREKWSSQMKEYFAKYPEKKKELFEKAKIQWTNKKLLKWRSQKTKEQWTPEFRIERKKTYNNTYQEKALRLMRGIFEKYGKLNKEKYNQERIDLRDKSLLKYETICQRFFDNSEEKLKEAVLNYNHKIKKIIRLKKKINVYDLEVEGTHNFALASGVFVHNSGKQARDRRSQAILPLRGKILNIERARLDKVLASKEIKALVIAMGTSIGEDFNIEKARYHKIIIMSDSDVDGQHIRTLLLTFFYRYFKPIIEAGYLYIAQSPLYKIQVGKSLQYAYTEEEKEKVLKSVEKESKMGGKINIQRYKGLGEMNPEQLWETTMDPATRVLLRVDIESAHQADKVFDVLMGKEVGPRKRFIQTHAKKVKNLDI
jgi:DNA gyrase subunit B